MLPERQNVWKFLPVIALGLILVRKIAPVSDSLDEVLSGLTMAMMLIFSGSYFWQERRKRQAEQPSGAAVSPSDQT
jgi:hypothetical protein